MPDDKAPDTDRAIPAVVIKSAPPQVIPPPAPERPSLAVQSARNAVTLGKWGAIALGVATVAAQVIAEMHPNLQGPIQALLQVLKGLGGAP